MLSARLVATLLVSLTPTLAQGQPEPRPAPADAQQVQIYTLKHHQAPVLAEILRAFLLQDEVVAADAVTNSLVVSARPANQVRVKAIIEPLELLRREQLDNRPAVRTGLRACTIELRTDSAATAFQVGDRIDVLGSIRLKPEIGSEATRKVKTMVLLQDIEIVALDSPIPSGQSGSPITATLHLAPIECLALDYARAEGTVAVTRRNSDDRLITYDPEMRIEVHSENILDFIKIAMQHRANVTRAEIGR